MSEIKYFIQGRWYPGNFKSIKHKNRRQKTDRRNQDRRETLTKDKQ